MVKARIDDPYAAVEDQIDILRLRHLTSVFLSDGAEHWLFSDGRGFVRLDIKDGTLIGYPSSLAYEISGLRTAGKALKATRRFIDVALTAEVSSEAASASRNKQSILELRVCDALASGASHADIARGLFAVGEGDQWRRGDDAVRTRVQRLVRRVRKRLLNPLDGWFRS